MSDYYEMIKMQVRASDAAYDYVDDNKVRQWTFSDGSMLQMAVDYSWVAVYTAPSFFVPHIVRLNNAVS